MSARTLGISEARKLLPQLVERIAEAGGRVDITRHGRVAVSIVRTADIEKRGRRTAPRDDSHPPAALRMELLVEEDALEDAMRRARANLWSSSGELEQVTSPPARAKGPRAKGKT